MRLLLLLLLFIPVVRANEPQYLETSVYIQSQENNLTRLQLEDGDSIYFQCNLPINETKVLKRDITDHCRRLNETCVEQQTNLALYCDKIANLSLDKEQALNAAQQNVVSCQNQLGALRLQYGNITPEQCKAKLQSGWAYLLFGVVGYVLGLQKAKEYAKEEWS